jgi:branched-chain amino acid transport system permease protein
MINDTSFYYLVFGILLICLYLIYRFIKSPFGQVLQGIRENESRMTALGYNVWFHKYIAFIVGGLFAGVAGVLFAYYNHQMTPVEFGIMTSTMGMLMVIIGSCTIVFGPALGAGIVVLLEHLSSIYAPQRWPLILGSVFVFAVIFLPGGFGSHLLQYWRKVTYGSIEG